MTIDGGSRMTHLVPKDDWDRLGATITLPCPKCGTASSVFVGNVKDNGKVRVNCPSRTCDFRGDVTLQGFKR